MEYVSLSRLQPCTRSSRQVLRSYRARSWNPRKRGELGIMLPKGIFIGRECMQKRGHWYKGTARARRDLFGFNLDTDSPLRVKESKSQRRQRGKDQKREGLCEHRDSLLLHAARERFPGSWRGSLRSAEIARASARLARSLRLPRLSESAKPEWL